MAALGTGALILLSCGDAERGTPVNGDSGNQADVAHIVCGKDTVRVDTPVVRAHRDGVTLEFENQGEVWGLQLHPETYEYGQAMGGSLRARLTEVTYSVPPGKVIVACLPTNDPSYRDADAATATFTVVDSDELYVPWDLACGFAEQSSISIAAAGGEDPAQVFRRVPGVRSSDELKKPNYPESEQHWPTSIVFRDGMAVARIGAPTIGEKWELIVNACPGSGIAGT